MVRDQWSNYLHSVLYTKNMQEFFTLNDVRYWLPKSFTLSPEVICPAGESLKVLLKWVTTPKDTRCRVQPLFHHFHKTAKSMLGDGQNTHEQSFKMGFNRWRWFVPKNQSCFSHFWKLRFKRIIGSAEHVNFVSLWKWLRMDDQVTKKA